jgi:hypothetical protein
MLPEQLPDLIADTRTALNAAFILLGMGGPLGEEDGGRIALRMIRFLEKSGWKFTRDQYKIPFGRFFL